MAFTVTQTADLLNNQIFPEITGESLVVSEDLSNIADIGKAIFDGTSTDIFKNGIVNKIGMTIIRNRTYISQAPNLLRYEWEYGLALEKIRYDFGKFDDNDSWTINTNFTNKKECPFEVDDDTSYSAKYFSKKITLEKHFKIPETQLKTAFTNAGAFMSFINGIYSRIETYFKAVFDSYTMSLIRYAMANKIKTAKANPEGTANNVINVLKLYNTANSKTLKAANCFYDLDFCKFFAKTIENYRKYIAGLSMLFNDEGYVSFTPQDRQKLVLLQDTASTLDAYLQSSTYHNELTKINKYETVAFWQGSGTSDTFDFNEISKISVDLGDVDNSGESPTPIIYEKTGIVACLFDWDALFLCASNYRTYSIFNPREELTVNYYKYDVSLFADMSENFIMFTVEDES